MANYESLRRKKRGRQPTKLSVKLFLLDPGKETTKITKETCSKENINKLMQKGYGPPQQEHCINNDKERVEFLFELTNEQFKQKLAEIYPKLENACFVFMKADKNNKLEELNPGRCCYRCYTPENIYHSERGQGRLYIRKIAENQISQCNHGIPLIKRLCIGNNQQRFIPILPKQLPSGSTITGVGTESRESVVMSVAMTTPDQQLASSTPGLSGIPFLSMSGATPVLDLSSSPIAIGARPPANSSGNVTTQSHPIPTSAIVSVTSPANSVVNMIQQGQLQTSSGVFGPDSRLTFQSSGNTSTQSELQTSAIIPYTSTNILGAESSHSEFNQSTIAMTTQGQNVSPSVAFTLPATTATMATTRLHTSVTMPTSSLLPLSTIASRVDSLLPDSNAVFVLNNQRQFLSPSVSSTIPNFSSDGLAALLSDLTTTEVDEFSSNDVSQTPLMHGDVNFPRLPERISQIHQFNLETGPSYRNQSLSPPLSPFPSRGGSTHSSGLQTLANATVERGPIRELPTASTSSLTTPVGQEHVNSAEPKISIEEFLEKVKSTEKLEISLDDLNNSELMKKLNESTINIRTIEIQSSCKLQQLLKDYSLPSCLEVLRIHDNYLNHKDIYALATSFSDMNCLYELDLARTKFEEGCIIGFIAVLINCRNLRKLCLTDNSLLKEDISCVTNVLNSMKALTHLNLSHSNLTETQANNILQNVGAHKTIVSLDLSQSALQGSEVISEICQIPSLEELNLSHNCIRFFSLPNSDQQHDNLPVNMQIISLSSNDMMPKDIGLFCNLVRSDLVKLNLDLNHVGTSIWFLCSLRIGHLKALSLAQCDINGFKTIDGLANLLRYTRELQELNLSCNNLMLNDFRKLQTHLSNLTQLKKLNLSNNPGGISSILEKILPSLKHLEELRLNNTHLNGEDFRKISVALASLKSLKHLELSGNAIGPEGAKALAGILKEFPLLERLDLSSSCVKEDHISILCTYLTPLKNLKYLNFSGNRIAVEVLSDSLLLPSLLEEVIFSDVIHGEKLFDAMRPLRYLRKLHLSKMNLRRRDVEALSTMLSSFPMLEDLTLSNIDIVDLKCERIFSAIKSLRAIRKIDVSGMILPDGEALADMLSACSLLVELVLNGMVVKDRNCERIFRAIRSLKKMTKLDFGGVDAKMNDIKAFSDMLSSLSFLGEIVFPTFTGKCDSDNDNNVDDNGDDNNNGDDVKDDVDDDGNDNDDDDSDDDDDDDHDDDDGMKRPLCSLKSARYLKFLDLRYAYISNSYAATLAEVIPCLQLLDKLVIRRISYNNRSEPKLFAALETLRYVKVLCLHFNIYQSAAAALTKVLPSLQSLGKLVLEIIDFDNEASNQFFCALGSLRYLKELDLTWTLSTGTGTEALADVLPRLTVLEKLTLTQIKFPNENSLQRLLAALGSLRYLRELEVKFYQEIESNTEASLYKLPSLQLLEKLVLENIECEAPEEQLLFEMPSYTFLRHLKLCYVKINSAALANVFSQQCLEALIVWGYRYNDNESENLFDAIGNLHNLKKLEAGYITVTETSLKIFARALSSLQLLEKLSLKGNYLYDETGKQMFDAIRKLKYLKELNLLLITIDQTGAEALAEALPSLESLEVLALGKIEFDDGKEEELFNAMRELIYLKELNLCWTLTNQNSVAALAEALLSLHLLKRLRLNSIEFSNKNDQQLFARIGTLKYLKLLSLYESVITQARVETLTDVLGNLPGLKLIVLPEMEGDSDRTLRNKLQEECSDLGIRAV